MTSESSRHVRGEAPADGSASHPLMDETISLTREFVHRYWNGGTSWCAARLSDDFAWMGAQDDQPDLSSDSFRRQMEQIAIERPRVVLMCEQYLPVAAQETLCIVAGSYLVFGDPASGRLAAQEQRFTFVWKRDENDDSLKICYCHVSHPLPPAPDSEPLSVSVSKQAYLYLKAVLMRQRQDEAVTVRDVDGTSWRINPDEIVCVEARKQRTVLHCEKTDATVHGCMGNVLEQLGLDMMYVHRSFAISPRHVASLEKRDLVMDNGLVIEIPTKRLSQVKKELFG